MNIDGLQLLTGDLVGQREFYTGVLGLPLLPGTAGALALRAGSSRIVFTQAPTGWNGVYHFAFNIPEDRFKEAKEWVSRRVPLIRNSSGQDEFNFEHWNAHSLYFYDPAGNIGEFIARHDLAECSDNRPFGGQSILSISEIGLATDDVHGAVRLIQDRTGAGIYDGEGSDAFTAVGDVYGLFIVVKTGRIWFPDTGKPAGLLQVQVAVSAEAGDRYVLTGPPYQINPAAS